VAIRANQDTMIQSPLTRGISVEEWDGVLVVAG
jgi:hypothetical protein